MSTLGGLYVVVASPQPGTSNQPYPVGNLPPYVPVVTTITSDHALLITQQKVLVNALLVKIHASLNEINKNLIEIDKHQKSLPKLITDLEPSLLSVASARSFNSTLIAGAIANVIRTNNFMVAVSPETPALLTTEEQIKTAIQDSMAMLKAMEGTVVATQYVTTKANAIVAWIGNTESYKSVAKWLTSAKDAVLGIILPPNAEDVTSKATSVAGVTK